MQEHEQWLRVAKDDLKAAKGLLPLELFSAVTYHCQQAAEKSLKAYLIFKGHPVVKTHDLVQLLELCMLFDKAFETKYEAVGHLNPFSTKFRYPSEYDIPDYEVASFAIKKTQSILSFIVKKIKAPVTGQTEIFQLPQKTK